MPPNSSPRSAQAERLPLELQEMDVEAARREALTAQRAYDAAYLRYKRAKEKLIHLLQEQQ